MKRTNNFAYICVFALLALLAMAGAAVFCVGAAPACEVCDGADLYALVNDKVVELYETEIAGCKVASAKTPAQLSRLASQLGVSKNKAVALLLLQDFAARQGDPKPITALAGMSELSLLSYAKGIAEPYLKGLSEERREQLKAKLKDAIKG